jgi:excisionase family DNA binding protein
VFKITEARRKQLLELIEEWMEEQVDEDSSSLRVIFSDKNLISQEINPTPTTQELNATVEKAVFTVKELSDYLCVSQDSIYAMVREKQIPSVRIRKRILFHRDSIDSWLKST